MDMLRVDVDDQDNVDMETPTDENEASKVK